jgi:predicted ATPase
MKFDVLPVKSNTPRSAVFCAYLISDNWDDYSEFSTLFKLFIFDGKGTKHDIGAVKIGQFQMQESQYRPVIQPTFTQLNSSFFSLGQDESYYFNLRSLGDEIMKEILTNLNDIAFNAEIYSSAIREKVTKVSLLRFVSETIIFEQFRRIIQGGARLTPFDFSFSLQSGNNGIDPNLSVSFQVNPLSNPPTNLHVIVGRNGVGKSYLLNKMTHALVNDNIFEEQIGKFYNESGPLKNKYFASVVSVSFSAFDCFDSPVSGLKMSNGIPYSYVGLKREQNRPTKNLRPNQLRQKNFALKNHGNLKGEFAESMWVCVQGEKFSRLKEAFSTLGTDPVFMDSDIQLLDSNLNEKPFLRKAKGIFQNLSSGHKIVVLTICKLIETVQERSLVLFDEPEAHLHPPLLSAFIRALSDFLGYRNAVGIIATHSPVVLQEVPKTCVWQLSRSGDFSKAERLQIETFGENTGSLTREVFGYEVTDSGFHKLLKDSVKDGSDFYGVLSKFQGELGSEAQAIIRGLIVSRSSSGNQ